MAIFGFLAMTMSLIFAAIALPAQIIKNYKRKSCDGMSKILTICIFLTYTFWMLYGWTKPDIFLIIPQTIGFVLSLILLIQFIYYFLLGKINNIDFSL